MKQKYNAYEMVGGKKVYRFTYSSLEVAQKWTKVIHEKYGTVLILEPVPLPKKYPRDTSGIPCISSSSIKGAIDEYLDNK